MPTEPDLSGRRIISVRVFSGKHRKRDYFWHHRPKATGTSTFATSSSVFNVSLLKASQESRQIFLEIFPLVLVHPTESKPYKIRFNNATMIYIDKFMFLRRSETLKPTRLPDYFFTLTRLAIDIKSGLELDGQLNELILRFTKLEELLVSTSNGIRSFFMDELQWLGELETSLNVSGARKWKVEKQDSKWVFVLQ